MGKRDRGKAETRTMKQKKAIAPRWETVTMMTPGLRVVVVSGVGPGTWDDWGSRHTSFPAIAALVHSQPSEV